MRGLCSTLAILLTLLQITAGQSDESAERLQISGHVDDLYNGVYWRAEDWGGVAHFEKEDGTAHLYWFDGGYWQLDYREQDGSQDYWAGGWTAGGTDYEEELSGEVWWSTSNYVSFQFGDPAALAGFEGPYTEQIEVSGHVDDDYNGIYYRMEDWNEFAHFAKEDRTAHLFHLDSGAGWWQLDYRE